MLAMFLIYGTSALASDLAWSWDKSESVKYRLETTLVAPQGQTWPAENNLVARVTETRAKLEVDCSGALDGKLWLVTCSLGQVELSGIPLIGKEDVMKTVFKEYAAEIEGKTVSFRMGPDGKVRRFDLKGVSTRNSDHGEVIDGLRQILRRAFTPFDLQLPKSGDDKGKKWSQKGSPMLFEVMTSQGTAGGVSLKHVVSAREEDAVHIESNGRAAVVDGATIEGGASSMIRISAKAKSQFNTALGVLDWGQVDTQSDHSASNMQGLSKDGPPRFSAQIGRIGDDGAVLKPDA